MFLTLSGALRGALAVAVLISSLSGPAPAGAGGPEHSHGPEDAPGAVQPHPRFVAESEIHQLVGVFRDGALTLYLDRQEDNAPVTDATITLEVGGRSVVVEPRGDGTWHAMLDASAGEGEIEIIATISGGQPDLLVASLTLGRPHMTPPHRKASGPGSWPSCIALSKWSWRSSGWPQPAWWHCSGWAWARDRKGPIVATILLVISFAGVTPASASPGHDHGAAAPAATATRTDSPRRLPDGSVFLAKSTQRLLEIWTTAAQEQAAERAITLIGRVVADPNRGGLVQSTVGGRVVPPEGELPRLGQTVARGDILALIEPPLPAADRTTIGERQGEIDQLIASAETRLARARTLAATGAGIRTQVVDIEVEREGLRRRSACCPRRGPPRKSCVRPPPE